MEKSYKILLPFLLISLLMAGPARAQENNVKPYAIQNSSQAGFEDLITQARKETLSGNFNNALKYLSESLIKASEKNHFKKAEALINYIYNTTDNPDYLNSFYGSLEKLVSSDPSSPAFDILVKGYEDVKNYEGIINLYRLKLLTKNSLISEAEKSVLFEKLGDMYEFLKQSPMNTENYKRALQFDQKNQTAREKLAYNLLLTGEIKEAEINYKKLLETNSANDNARFGLGIINYIKGDAKNAAEEFKLIRNKDKQAALMEMVTKYELAKGTLSNLFRYWAL